MGEQIRSIFAKGYKIGPHGIGDPDDKRLRKVEKDVLIPQKMRDKAKEEKCFKEVEELWYNNPQFKEECTREYLEERSEYRRTGIPTSAKRKRTLAST